MREVRIYSPVPLRDDSQVELDDNAARHILQVLRLQEGQPLTLFDGSGGEFPAVIAGTARKRVTVTTGKRRSVERESTLQITLWHGLCRGERMDNVLQKATELGVQIVQPLLSERSMVKLDAARSAKKLSHWQGVVASACEQCGRNRLPEVRAPATLDRLLPSVAGYACAVLLDPRARQPLGIALRELPATSRLILCCGPEGGFSAAEIAAAQAAGMQIAHMGQRILRTETAPLAALAIAQQLAGTLDQPGTDPGTA